MKNQTKYGYWRMDKDQEPGYTRELISVDTKKILHGTHLDSLDIVLDKPNDTFYKIL